MKKISLFVAAMMLLLACDNTLPKYGPGGANAVQFVKEQVPELRDDIKDIEVIAEDSLLSDAMLIITSPSFAKAAVDYLNGELSRGDYESIIDERSKILSDISYSWVFPSINDSLKTLEKYQSYWRKVYTVRVTMKSGDVKEPRVLMDTDGISPRALESEFKRSMDEYESDVETAYMRCY